MPVSQLIRHLPPRLLALLDAWSHRVAQRRARKRQQLWMEKKAAATR